MRLAVLPLAGLLIAGLSAGTAVAQTAPAETISIVEPFGPGSPSELAIRVLKPALERELKARILIEHIGSANGDAALARVFAGPANGRMLLAVTDASRIFHEYQANTPRRLDQLRAVAKLTEGISMALVTPPGSAIDTWRKFAEAAKAKPLGLAGSGQRSPSALFQAMVERHLGQRFAMHRYDLDVEILGAMARDDEPGILATSSALAQPALGRPAPHILLTSGARRHPLLPEVPTLAEVTGDRGLAFTVSVGLFGPPGLETGAVEALNRALTAAGKDEAVRAEAHRLTLPLAIKDAAVLIDTMKRTRRVIQELSHL